MFCPVRRPFVLVQRSAPVLKTIPVCATYSSARDSRITLLLSIILGSVVKTTSLQVTAKTMKTISCAHRVQCRSCPSPKAVIRVTSSLHTVQHNAVDKNTTNGDLSDFRSPFLAVLPFTNAKKMAAYINVSPAILCLYLPYKFKCNTTTIASRIIYIYLPTYIYI